MYRRDLRIRGLCPKVESLLNRLCFHWNLLLTDCYQALNIDVVIMLPYLQSMGLIAGLVTQLGHSCELY